MAAYNGINGAYCSENDWLLGDVLRRDWDFQGAVVTDWGAANDRVRGLLAGNDLEMPTSGGLNNRRVLAAVRRGDLAEAVLDRAVARVVELVLKIGRRDRQGSRVDADVHHALARRAAAESMVLLKNDDELLPIGPDACIAVIGAFAKAPRYQGTGSSRVTPTRLSCAFDSIQAIGVQTPVYAAGYDPEASEPDPVLDRRSYRRRRSRRRGGGLRGTAHRVRIGGLRPCPHASTGTARPSDPSGVRGKCQYRGGAVERRSGGDAVG